MIDEPKPFTGKIKPQNGKTRQKREKRPPKKITKSYLHNSGLYYLERFAASSGHFRSVMMRKIRKSCAFHKDQDMDECIQILDNLIEQFISSGLLDDEAYTRGNVTSMRRRGMSSRAIKAKLGAKSVPANQIQNALDNFNDDHDISRQDIELASAIKFAQKKRLGAFYDKAPSLPDDLREKHLARLARQGFPYDVCSKIIEMDESALNDILYEANLF